MKKPRPLVDTLLGCLAPLSVFAVAVSGCTGGGGSSSTSAGTTTAPASTPAPTPTPSWTTEQVSATPGDYVPALAGTASAGSTTLAVAIADEVLVNGQREGVGAQVEALEWGPEGLAASTTGGIYLRASAWALAPDGPGGPAALAATADRLYACSGSRLDVVAQGTWTNQAGAFPADVQPTAAAEHGGALWVGGQTAAGPAFLSRGTQADGFTTVDTPDFLCGPDEVQRVTDLLSTGAELFVAVGTFAASGDPIRGEIYHLDANGAPEQLLVFQQDVPSSLASLNGVVYAGTLVGRIIHNELGSVWLPESGLPRNQGIYALLALDGELIAGAKGPDGALLLIRSLSAGGGTSAPGGAVSGGGGPTGLPADVAAALNDCTICHAWATDRAQVLARVDLTTPASSVLLLKATGTSTPPHGGGAPWTTTGNAHYDTVLAWIQGGAPAGSAGSTSGGGGTGSTFVHTWPLTGAHQQATCGDCHTNNVFVGTSTDCSSCHLPEYQATTSPAHATSGYPLSCDRCHTTSGFAGASFAHPWTFEGAHVMVANDCTQCHQNQAFAGTVKDCFACHQQDFVQTVEPNHMAAGFPTTCDGCHTQATFAGAAFTHTWPFTGAHLNVANSCNTCHADQVYAGRSSACYACHSQNFLTTANPSHTAAGFATTCESCHTTASFAQAPGFNHTWPFTGAHLGVANDCNACHADQVFAGRSSACYACHSQDYAQALPNHAASGFGTNCEACHTTTQFTGATFNHRFPQRHGNANSCSTCHPDTANYANFSCTGCHDKTRTDNKHQGRRGYSYTSTACLSCHPNGRE